MFVCRVAAGAPLSQRRDRLKVTARPCNQCGVIGTMFASPTAGAGCGTFVAANYHPVSVFDRGTFRHLLKHSANSVAVAGDQARHGVQQTSRLRMLNVGRSARVYRRSLASVVRCSMLKHVAPGAPRVSAIEFSLSCTLDLVASPGKSPRTRFLHPGAPIRLCDPTESLLSAAAIAWRGNTLASSSDPYAAPAAV